MECSVEELFKLFHSKLKAYVVSRTNDSDLANDIIQDTYVKLYKHCSCGGDCTYPKSYLYKITSNAIMDHYRSSYHTKTRRITENDEESTDRNFVKQEDEKNLNKHFIECLITLIDNLPPKYQEALRLADIEEIPQKEIAKQLGISISGAKSRVQRGRVKLKEMLMEICKIEHDRYGNIINCQYNR